MSTISNLYRFNFGAGSILRYIGLKYGSLKLAEEFFFEFAREPRTNLIFFTTNYMDGVLIVGGDGDGDCLS
jgi:hypothetical protein